jgi:integrase/recombinase XerD
MKQECLEVSFPTLLQDFFYKRLIDQRNASARTIASYRDTFCLLLRYAEERIKKPPAELTMEDLDAQCISSFLDHLEKERGNSLRSRNLRLSAIRSFMRYSASRNPTSLPLVERVLAIPNKRFNHTLVNFLSRDEMEAVINAPDRSTWSGHRDHVMFTTFYNTGARVSEIIGLRIQDVRLYNVASVQIVGKGRKQRAMPLWKRTASSMKQWLRCIGENPQSPVFPNRLGKPLSRSGVEHRLKLAAKKASRTCPTLRNRKVSPHTIRHTTAMHLLQAGERIEVIALWLGHEHPNTTHQYVEADMTMKERALSVLQEPRVRTTRYRPNDQLLAFLESL